MELQHLRTFVTVAEQQSLTRAGERLHLSQPSVSAHVKALEESLGVSLFHRTGRGVALTDAGRELLTHAKGILAGVDRMGRRARELNDGIAASLHVGVIDCGFDMRLARIVGRVRHLHPQLAIQLSTATSGEHLRAVVDEEVDLAFVEGAVDDRRLHTWRLGTSRVGILAPEAWRDRLTDWASLSHVPWVLQGAGCSHVRLLEGLAREHGIAITPEFRSQAFGAVKDLVLEGLAVSIADLDQVAPWIEEGRVFAFRDLTFEMPMSLVALARRVTEPTIAAFVETTLDTHDRVSDVA